MEKQKFGENGDFTILEDVVSKLTGNTFTSSEGDTSFPVMDLRDQDDDDDAVDLDTTKSGGFQDERTASEDDTSSIEDIIEEDLDKGDKEDLVDDVIDNVNTEDDDTIDIPDLDEGDAKLDVDDSKDSITEIGDAEPEVTAFVQEKLFDKLGWEFNEDDALDSVDALVDYMEKIVETNSKPNFANKDIEELNTFVSDGGNLKDYFDTQGDVDVDKLDLSAEFNQKLVIKESLIERGLSDAQANKKIQRYDESGILEEEALDAKEYVQNIRKEKADSLLQSQKKAKQLQEQQQQKFYADVNSTIDGLKDVRGIPVNKATKNKLRDAILKVGPDGQTSYQKKYNENLIKNMLESAYFTIEGDKMVKSLTNRAESRATKNLKKKLETRTKKGKVSGSLESDNINNNHKVLDVFDKFIKP